ncbi:MAG: WxcM-like domain-containing protein [Proteobacteria bacterium]|nr:MAG: WxcM-like domain-containing protein [Pseudomonadota bacterium]
MDFKVLNLADHGDERGCLVALESSTHVPFKIERVYYIFETKPDVRRGAHAHRDLNQLAICVSGSCTFELSDGKEKSEVVLNSPTKALFIGNMIWREMHSFSEDCVLMVLASRKYDELDYIRDYDSFLKLARRN